MSLLNKFKQTFQIEDTGVDFLIDDVSDLCPHYVKCNKTCFASKHCKVRDFYERYPDYEFLGVGAATEVPGV